jgi:GrpB-like predicted nucleotidyltransferase (UPF0157 family)
MEIFDADILSVQGPHQQQCTTEYEDLKCEPTAEHDDLVAYSEGKSTFIKRILEVARTDESLTFDFTIPTPS